MDRNDWERDVIEEVASLCECSISDAQAIVEAQSNVLDACWRDQEGAMHTAANVEKTSRA